MATTLISWLGRTDLRAVTETDQVGLGPVAQALQTGRFARLELLCDYPPDEAAAYLAWLQTQAPTPVTPHYVTLDSPTDFGAIYRHARAVVASTSAAQPPADGLAFHLSPGTPAMAAVWIILAKTRFPAELIEGESGTGKELLARAIHQASPRRARPFVTVNCGAIAPDLIESELFGHEKGAFTGAAGERKGYFESAHLGTLFLDELGELPKPAQVKLLRALQEGEVTRVGATAPIPVDVRILAATNPWPGNVREMQNTLRRAAVWTPGPTIDLEDARDALLPSPTRDLAGDPTLTQDIAQGIDLTATIDQVARHYLEQAMRLTGGNKTRAARLLGFGNPTTLNNWLKKHGVEP